MSELRFIKDDGGVEFYNFKPTFTKLYYNAYSTSEEPPYIRRFAHKLRMIKEIFESKYQVVYMVKDKKIIGHLVVGCGGSKIEMSKKRDIVIGPIWVVPNQRSFGYASQGIRFVLNEMNIKYDYAYEYIKKDNISSIRTVEKNGFDLVGECDLFGIFKKVRLKKNGQFNVYRKKNTNS